MLERFLDGGSDVVSASCFCLDDDDAGMLMPLVTACECCVLAAISVVFRGFILEHHKIWIKVFSPFCGNG